MTIVKKEKKEDAIMVDPYAGNMLYVKPEILKEGWTRLSNKSMPEFYSSFYIRNGFEIIPKGLKTELRRIGYDCLAFRWPVGTALSNRLTFVFVPKSCRVGVTEICVPIAPRLTSLRFAEQYPLIEVHQHRYGLGWRLNHGIISDVRDVTKFTPFAAWPGYDKVSFRENLPILQFLDPTYERPKKKPKIERTKGKTDS